MKNENRQLSEYRLSKAHETYKEGIILLQKGFYGGAINRFYYASFYAAKALLATKGLDASKHSGVISLFHEHFVKTGLFDIETAKNLSRSFEKRQDSDYEDFVPITEKDAESSKKEVKKFIDECEKVLKRMVVL